MSVDVGAERRRVQLDNDVDAGADRNQSTDGVGVQVRPAVGGGDRLVVQSETVDGGARRDQRDVVREVVEVGVPGGERVPPVSYTHLTLPTILRV